MSDSSDIDVHPTLPKKKTNNKDPSNHQPKKLTTKMMIHQALTDLKSRKGTSFYAIKKYINENFNVDVEKINYIIKKLIKTEVEAGTIVQMKGVGASGSFKLVTEKSKPQKKKEAKTKKVTEKTAESGEKPKIKQIKPDTKKKKKDEEQGEKKENEKTKVSDKKKKLKTIVEDEDKMKKPKTLKQGKSKGMQTPAKKRAAMLKRKSIGSIIKPPKMKPKKANG